MPAAASGKFFFSISFQISRMYIRMLFVVLTSLVCLFTPGTSGEIMKPRKANKAVEGASSAQMAQMVRDSLQANTHSLRATLLPFSLYDSSDAGILLELTEIFRPRLAAGSVRTTPPDPRRSRHFRPAILIRRRECGILAESNDGGLDAQTQPPPTQYSH